MMEGISRRSFVATAGVGAVVATASGCNPTTRPEGASGSLKMGGIDPAKWTHGDLPGPYQQPPNKPEVVFDPKYDVLVYIKFGPEMDLLSKIFYFEKSGTEFDTMVPGITSAILALRADINAVPKGTLPKGVSSFRDFTFKAAANIAIYVDHSSLSYPEKIVPVFFTDKLLDGKTAASKNKSFYDAAVHVNAIDTGPGGWRDAVYLRNYFMEAAPNDMDNVHGNQSIPYGTDHKYAMNIIMLAEQPMTPVRLPLIFDPDTGNNGTTGRP